MVIDLKERVARSSLTAPVMVSVCVCVCVCVGVCVGVGVCGWVGRWVGVSIKSICVEVDLHNVLITSEPQDSRRVTTNERGFLIRSGI